MKIVITSGYNQSLHSIALINKLIRQGHQIVGCLIVNIYDYNRFKKYLRMYGIRILIEKYKNLVLKKKGILSKESFYIEKYMRNNLINEKLVSDICYKNNIKYKFVNNLNNKISYNFLKNINTEMIIYSGGGILSSKIINLPTFGVLNAHSGSLPFFRGMNVVEWSLFYNFHPTVTVHMINNKIDLGDILYKKKINLNSNDTILDIRGKSVVEEVKLILIVMSKIKYYLKQKQKQKENQGKQFFVMHDKLKYFINTASKKKLYDGDNIKMYRFK